VCRQARPRTAAGGRSAARDAQPGGLRRGAGELVLDFLVGDHGSGRNGCSPTARSARQVDLWVSRQQGAELVFLWLMDVSVIQPVSWQAWSHWGPGTPRPSELACFFSLPVPVSCVRISRWSPAGWCCHAAHGHVAPARVPAGHPHRSRRTGGRRDDQPLAGRPCRTARR
jgi:hypothetical protein